MVDIIGQRFGQLTVLEFSHKNKWGASYFLCECDCGTRKVIKKDHFAYASSETKSCGCLRQKLLQSGVLNRKHGMRESDEYHIWSSMIQRCSRRSHARKNYFDRGISVCAAWCGRNGFVNFFKHIGTRPSRAHSIDRINNDKGYYPGNVRWATPKEQAANRRAA